MNTNRMFLIMIFIIANSMQLSSQDKVSDSLRETLLEFLISKGDFDNNMETDGVIILINDISNLKEYKYQGVGVFKFGTLTSHSYFHLLLIGKNNYVIVNMRQPYERIVLELLNYFQENQFYSKNELLLYFDKATELYIKNQNVVPWNIDN